MVTRKTPSKTTAARTARTAAVKAASKPAAAEPKTRPAAPPKPRTTPAPPAAAAAVEPRKAQPAPIEAPSGEARYRWIAHAAYLRAEKRGFAPGQEVDDWLAAEAEFTAAFKPH